MNFEIDDLIEWANVNEKLIKELKDGTDTISE